MKVKSPSKRIAALGYCIGLVGYVLFCSDPELYRVAILAFVVIALVLIYVVSPMCIPAGSGQSEEI